jgi:hypothetical protein
LNLHPAETAGVTAVETVAAIAEGAADVPVAAVADGAVVVEATAVDTVVMAATEVAGAKAGASPPQRHGDTEQFRLGAGT